MTKKDEESANTQITRQNDGNDRGHQLGSTPTFEKPKTQTKKSRPQKEQKTQTSSSIYHRPCAGGIALGEPVIVQIGEVDEDVEI